MNLSPLNRLCLRPSVLLAAALLLSCVFLRDTSQAQGLPANQWHKSLAAMPTMSTTVVTNEGKTLNTSRYLDFFIFYNSDSSDHTVTLQDAEMSPFYLFNATTIKAGQTWIFPTGGVLMISGIKWSASSATVQGALVGR